jgi:hypothetical protein
VNDNIVDLLLEALEFYSDEVNYKKSPAESPVEADNGAWAREILEEYYRRKGQRQVPKIRLMPSDLGDGRQ